MGIVSVFTLGLAIIAGTNARHLKPPFFLPLPPQHFRPASPLAATSLSNVDCSIPINQVTLHPHPTSCYHFLQCDNGRTVERPCAAGTEFSPSIGVCVHPWQSDCTARQEEPEVPEESEEEVPESPEEPEKPEEPEVPEEPEKPEPVEPDVPEEEEPEAPATTEAPIPEIPDEPENPAEDEAVSEIPEEEPVGTTELEPEIGTEEPATEEPLEEVIDPLSICAAEPSRIFLAADPSDCANYVICNAGLPLILSCASGEYFDAAVSQCLQGLCSV